MTVDEMHIALDLELRGTNTFTFRSLEREEKDWWLNRAQYDFIWSKTELANNTKGLPFAITQKRLDDIQNLIYPKTCKLFREREGVYFTHLPSDYLMLIADSTLNVDICNLSSNLKEQTINFNYSFIELPTLNSYTNLKISLFKLNNLNEEEEIVIFNALNYQAFINSINDKRQKFYLIYLIKELVREFTDIDIYWENFNNIYKKNNLCITSLTNYTKIEISVNSSLVSSTFNQIEYKNYYSQNGKYINSSNVPVSPENLNELLDDWFYKPKGNKCLLTIKNDKLYVYTALNVQPNSISFEYYRIPKIINYLLEQTSDIVSTRHDDLVSRAALKIANRNPNDNVQFLNSDFIQTKEN